jgi:N-acetylglutamate synthase-like GNAT family acetyltransferase
MSSDASIETRRMRANDGDAILAFARALPPRDLLFLQRDIRNEKVVAAWIDQEEQGLIRSLVATAEGEVRGCAAVVRDTLSWSPHVAEIRVVVASDWRGEGLGRRLAQEAFALAVTDGVEKIFVRFVPDQAGAIALFEEMGFRAEAMLRNHVRDAEGEKHDIAILSLDVLRQGGQHRAYGMG